MNRWCDQQKKSNLEGPASFIIQLILSLYRGLNQGSSDPEADDIPMCHHAFLLDKHLKAGATALLCFQSVTAT